MLDQRFHAPQRLGASEDPNCFEEPARGFETASNLERHHSAKSLHLAPRQPVLRVIGQSRIGDLRNFRLLGKKLGDRRCVLGVALHSQVQRLYSPQYQEAVERRRYSPDGVLVKVDSIGELLIARASKPPDAVAVAVDVL